MDYTWHYDSSLGGITLASDGEALIGLWFDGQRYFADTLDKEHKVKRLPVFDDTCRWLDTYFSGKAPDFTPKLNMRTSAFRKKVWEIMLAIQSRRANSQRHSHRSQFTCCRHRQGHGNRSGGRRHEQSVNRGMRYSHSSRSIRVCQFHLIFSPIIGKLDTLDETTTLRTDKSRFEWIIPGITIPR